MINKWLKTLQKIIRAYPRVPTDVKPNLREEQKIENLLVSCRKGKHKRNKECAFCFPFNLKCDCNFAKFAKFLLLSERKMIDKFMSHED